LLGWSQTKLAKAADLSRPTVDRAERESVSDDALAALREALETAGVIFVEENGEGPGVRLRKEKRT
jgi:DNA-binding XRE family transcriptional regulator